MNFSDLNIEEKPGKVRYSVICPKCNDTRQKHKNVPCLTVNNEPDNRWFHCNHPTCGYSGNLDLLDKYDKVREKSRIPKQIAVTYSKEVREYWDSRGIDVKLCLSRKIFDFLMGTKPIIGFPTYIHETLVDVKYLSIQWKKGDEFSKWWNLNKEYGTKTLPWGLEHLNFPPDKPKIITWTEGHIDTLTWYQCGYENIISVPSGAPSTKAEKFEHEFDYITDKYVQSKIGEATLHIIATDADEAGIKLRNHLAIIIGKDKCKYINYPVSYKDINEVFKGVNKDDKQLPALGKAGVDECYNNLSSFPIAGIIKLGDVREDLRILAQEGFTPGLKCGVPEIDFLYTEKPKRLQVVTGLPGSGKALDINTLIPYIGGFKKMEMIQIGDTLFDENGEKCKVINTTDIMYNRPCYKITFSDNTEIIADEDHLWHTTTRAARMSALLAHKRGRDTGRALKNHGTDQSHKREIPCLKTTKQISESLFREHGRRLNHSIIIAHPITWENERKLLLDPYVLGIWLGDGHSEGGRMTSADIEIIEEIRNRGYQVTKHKAKYNWGILNIRNLLYQMGLLKNKNIPSAYIYNSIETRTELLMGLMDTDGYMCAKTGRAEFCSTNKNLAEGVYQILCSLGMTPTLLVNDAKLYGRFISLRYRVNVFPNTSIFKLKRKLEKQNLIKKRSDYRYIRNCVKIDTVPVKCIMVDSPSKLFLCSKACIPTHNSTYVRWHETEVVRHNSELNLKYGWFSPENRPVAREYAKMAEVVSGQYFKEGWKNSMTPELRNKTLRWIEKHFFIISPDRRNFDPFNGRVKADKVNTMASLCEYLVYLKKTENIYGYIIDAWNKIEHEQPKNMTETQYISQQLDHLIDFNDYYDLHGIIIAHPTKVEKVGINYRMPCLYDIKGSSSWKEKADAGIVLHRNVNRKKPKEDITDDMDEDDKYYVDQDTPTILRTEKIRFEEEGNMNRIKIRMDSSKGGRFFVVNEKEKKPHEQIVGALNPPKDNRDSLDDVFSHDDLDSAQLPF